MKKEQAVKPRNRREQRVLNYCNSIRARLGLRPRKLFRKGVTKLASSCVIALTISQEEFEVVACHNYVGCYKANFRHTNPKFIHQFITDFDKGRLPHLEI